MAAAGFRSLVVPLHARPCRGGAANAAAGPGRRAAAALHRRREPVEPPADPRGRAREGVRRAAGHRCGTVARGGRSDGGDAGVDDRGRPSRHCCRQRRDPAAAVARGGSAPARNTDRVRRSALRSSRSPRRSSSAWRRACRSPGTACEPGRRARCSPSHAAPPPAARRSVCATRSWLRRSPSRSCCSRAPACWGSACRR